MRVARKASPRAFSWVAFPINSALAALSEIAVPHRFLSIVRVQARQLGLSKLRSK
jgi:hypothetical protein